MPPREFRNPNQPFIASKSELSRFRPLTPEETARAKGEIKTEKIGQATEGMISMESAEKILGQESFHGPSAVEQTFGIKIPESEVPPIPFTAEDLERAKELGQMLILRVDTAPDGQPLTMEKMHELLQDKFTKEGKGKVLYDTAGWKKDKDFFIKETPELRWALVSKEVIPNSTSKNYLQQTEIISDYLRNTVFKDKTLPTEYAEAIKEFYDQKADIEKAMKTDDWQKAAELLSNLQINQFTRQTPAEILYDILIHFQTTGEYLLGNNKLTWTSRRSSGGGLVGFGLSDADGVNVSDWDPVSSIDGLGAAFSRSL